MEGPETAELCTVYRAPPTYPKCANDAPTVRALRGAVCALRAKLRRQKPTSETTRTA